MNIEKKDILWNYGATFLQIASSVLLFPFILRILPQETVAIWTIFSTIISFGNLLDLGFNPSFARNVSYVFSGVKSLKKEGYNIVETNHSEIDYGLFKSLLRAMRFFYSRMAFILLIILITFGTFYIYTILKKYSGDTVNIYIAWAALCLINTYSFYTSYYDTLLTGMGLIKTSKQITILSQIIYLTTAIIFILLQFGLIAIVSAQIFSVITRRILSHFFIFTSELKDKLKKNVPQSQKHILKAIFPNALKIGITALGSFLVSRSAIIIGSLFLQLDTIASYGITIQIVGIINGIAMVFFGTYQPKIVQYRVQNNTEAIKNLYISGFYFLFFTYLFGGLALLFFGNWALNILDSKTLLLNKTLITVVLIISFLENNHALAGGILLTKNEVPFFKASILSGIFTIILLVLLLKIFNIGVLGMIIAPGIAQLCYQNWKWPKEVIKELRITMIDFSKNFFALKNELIKLFKTNIPK
jgi:O-antigen/teichoic acid export membrane protein